MTKDDLLSITLDQLLDALKRSPECFELIDKEIESNNAQNNSIAGPTIKWSFKLDMGNGNVINDPNNAAKTIIIYYNTFLRQLVCQIFFREIHGVNSAIMAEAQAAVSYGIPFLHSTYRKFMKLRKKLIKRHKDIENRKYLRKLQTIFPGTFDDDIFG